MRHFLKAKLLYVTNIVIQVHHVTDCASADLQGTLYIPRSLGPDIDLNPEADLLLHNYFYVKLQPLYLY